MMTLKMMSRSSLRLQTGGSSRFRRGMSSHVLQLRKAVYGTVQAARRRHTKISRWMEDNEYCEVNSEKTIFMKRDGKDFIMQLIFVDDMKHVPTAKYLLGEFLEKYSRDFEITGGHHLMESFIGLDV